MVEILMIIGMVLMLVWVVVGIMTIMLMVVQIRITKEYAPMQSKMMSLWEEEEA